MLIENEKVPKINFMGLFHQTLAGEKQGLKTMEVWLVTLPPNSEIPLNQHYGEAILITLKGTGRATVDQESLDLFPDTTLVVPPRATRQVVNNSNDNLVVLIIRSLLRTPGKTVMEILASRP